MGGGIDDGYSEGSKPVFAGFDPGGDFRQVVIVGGGMVARKITIIAELQKLKLELQIPLTIIDDPLMIKKQKPYRQQTLSNLSRFIEEPKANNGPAYRTNQANKWSNKYSTKIKRK